MHKHIYFSIKFLLIGRVKRVTENFSFEIIRFNYQLDNVELVEFYKLVLSHKGN